MEAIQSYPNLLSEKQAAARLGVARITLLRAREAGRIRFFRIGTRVLYCEEQITEFLNSCHRNARQQNDGAPTEPTRRSARRRDNQVSASRRSVSARESTTVESADESREAGQASFQFVAAR
jgi:excisionase family DNA binding protein